MYSVDRAPYDQFLFLKLKIHLKGQSTWKHDGNSLAPNFFVEN